MAGSGVPLARAKSLGLEVSVHHIDLDGLLIEAVFSHGLSNIGRCHDFFELAQVQTNF